ncbi:MAG: xanthine dehydrogenase family protein subunit M [Acidobacteria bacterium]|nr:xanthine dehydrogenase family protein subunit M [Acidobacteriota bacterium]
MIPQNFEYSAPTSLSDALAQIVGGKARALAGGMSLIPIMKLRLAAPEQLVDLGRVPGLSYIREEKDGIHVGAMTTHYEVESSPLVRSKCPLLAEAAANIGDVQVRNMGTLGGSIAHADPAADYPASLMALEARLKLVRAGGERTLTIEEFLVDPFTTALEPGELISEVILPLENAGTGVAYQKMVQSASGFAIVGVAARIRQGFARVGVTGLAGKAYRAREVERLLEGGADARTAAARIADGVDANSDLHASADYRRNVAQIYAARAITRAQSGAA